MSLKRQTYHVSQIDEGPPQPPQGAPEWQGPMQPPQMRAPGLRERAWGALESQADRLGPMGRLLGLAGADPNAWVARAREASDAELEREQYGDTASYAKAVMRGEAKGPPLSIGIMPGLPGKGLTSLASMKPLSAAEAAAAKEAEAIAKARSAPKFKLRDLEDFELTKMRSYDPKSTEPFSFTQLPAAARPTAVYNAILQNGGYSVHPATGEVLTPGTPGPTMAGMFPNSSDRTMVIPKADFKPRDVQKFFLKNRDVFSKKADANIGGWVSKGDDGIERVYLDVSRGHENVRQATKFAETQNPGSVRGKATGVVRNADGTWPKGQLAVYHPGADASPPVGNHAEFVSSGEFQTRLDEMAKIGHQGSAGANWWDIRNGPIARVYGNDRTDKAAGFMAATSPQNGPIDNMQMASEYIRRSIKGEPMVQPEWRAPSTAMGSQNVGPGGFSPKPGAKFPGSGTSEPNATLIESGQGYRISSDKVNDMRRALLGDPDVAVIDRHYAKLAEAPERGIYTSDAPNKVDPSMGSGKVDSYPLIENAVRTAAKRAGAPLADYSAWVWEGIRQTIRSTGKLYGQQHKASAIPETTTGFNEIFTALVEKKAQHLGVSVGQLEGMLRNGSAELLTALLATPVGMEAFRRWKASAPSGPAGTQP